MKHALLVALGCLLSCSIAAATSPDPPVCSVEPSDALNGLYLAPSGSFSSPASINLITVRNSSNDPVANASVVVTLTPANTVCGSTVLVGTTDTAGQVTLTLGGGGCANDVPLSGVIKANGVTIRAYDNVKSPDFDGARGDLTVNMADLITFAAEFLGNAGTGACHDYNNDGTTGLQELVLFGPTFTWANSCTP